MRAATAFSLCLLAAASLVILPGAPALADSCSYDPTTHTVSISFSGSRGRADNEVKVAGGEVTFEGTPCSGATVSNTDTITASGGSGDDRFVIDIGGGPFAPGLTAEADATSEIEMNVNAGDGSDVVVTKGSSASDVLVVGDGGFNLNGDSDADVFFSATENVALHGRGGNDVLNAQGGFGTGGAVDRPVFVSGHAGSDRLFGGRRGFDVLLGGAGRDIAKGGRGGDLLQGERGPDKLFGQGQNDQIWGRGGNDRLVGGSGQDTCIQGRGRDTVRSCETLTRPE